MDNQKFTYKQYQQLLKLSLSEKIVRAHDVIIEALQKHEGNVAVACSWGKDSIVLTHLVRQFCSHSFIEFNNTGVEYPQTLKYRDRMLKEWNIQNYVETKPDMTFWQCIEKYGYPNLRRMSGYRKNKSDTPKCCKKLKEQPDHKFCKQHNIGLKFVGLQASESMVRRLSFLREGELYFSNAKQLLLCRPLMIWTDQDVWAYHELYGIPKNPLYTLMPRNGCMPCTGFKSWQKVMAKANPQLYRQVARKTGNPTLHDCNFAIQEVTV